MNVIKLNPLLKSAVALAVVPLASSCGRIVQPGEDHDRPNFVFILVDDYGWSDVSYNGSETYETPNVDRLASEGMVFTDFYSGGPVSSPTRASIMTGKYTARTGITAHLITPDRDPEHVTNHLPLEEFTIAEALKEQGYATAFFGKWHLGYKPEHWASHQGFDVAIGGSDAPQDWELARPGEPYPVCDWRGTQLGSHLNQNGRFFSPHHFTWMEDGPEGEYLCDRLTNEAIRFITDNKDNRFFLYLPFHCVHRSALQPRNDVWNYYSEKIKSMGLDTLVEENPREKQYQNDPYYAGMVHHMDESVGRLMDALEDLGLESNTVFIWTSDNGGSGDKTSNLPLKGMKHNLDEGGIRVPAIIKWPGKIEAGASCGIPLISNDFYPTMLDMANLPLIPEQHVDGISLKDILLGKRSDVDREAIYWHYPHSRMEGAVRKGDFKLLHYYETGETRLYNLRDDIGEKNDLSDSDPARKEEMLGMLKSWLKDVGARFPAGMVIE